MSRLLRAQALARIGSWEINLRSKQMWGSLEAFRIYGLQVSADQLLPLSVAQTIALPMHRPVLDRALRELISTDAPYNVDFEICRQNDGAIRTIHSMAQVVRDSANNPVLVSGTIHDVTERVAAERAMLAALRASEERARTAFEQAADAIFLGNQRGDFVAVNAQAQTLTGYSREELLQGNMRMLFSEAMRSAAPLRYDLVLEG